jgi:ABC-type multidrug transport system fused ATPase/permease subunit
MSEISAMGASSEKRYRSILQWSLALAFQEKLGTLFASLRGLVIAPMPLLMKIMVDEAVEGGSPSRLLGAGLLAGGLMLLHYPLAVYGAMRIAVRLETVIADFRSYIFNRVQYISFGYLDTAATGKLVSKYSFDTQRVHDSMLAIANQIVPGMLHSFGTLLILMWINWRLAFVVILILPIFFVVRRGYLRIFKERNHEARVAQENLTGKAGELIHSVRMVRSLGQDEAAKKNIRWDNNKTAFTRFRVITISSHFGTFIFVAGQILTLILLGAGAWLVLRGDLTAGTLLAFVAAMPQILKPVDIISNLLQQLIVGNESYRSVREFLDSKLVERWQGQRRLEEIRGEIELRGIDFSYPSKPDLKVLENFNLHIKAGENLALVGLSGSGKSTLTYLVLGLYETQAGTIRVDGLSLDELDVRWFRQNCAIVMQDNILLSGSIAENLRFAKGNASDDEIREAARLANADSFINDLPNGYDTVVGERGAMLSGGQRQRISIARAILRDPAILILDEATSALDNESERLIQEAIARLSRGRTVITIAHRLDTIRNADRIIVMERGKIMDEGTFAELSAKSPHFQRLLTDNETA